jgi:hypothetical protein
MKKLNLDRLTVDSFATTDKTSEVRGTVAARENTGNTCPGESYGCPDSWDGTCWMTCWNTCPCTDGPNCP